MDRSRKEIELQSAAGLRTAAIALLLALACLVLFATPVLAQEGPTPTPPAGSEEDGLEAPERVYVQPTARDDEIRQRLQDILKATGWFSDPTVRVQDGVVFLSGQTSTDEYKRWAGDLARNTQDVAAAVNQIEVTTPPILDFQPAVARLREQGRSLVGAAPLIVFSLLVLILAWMAARLVVRATRRSLRQRQINPLLRNVLARGIGLLVFLVGLYLVFQIAGLASVALTVIGGTGLLGLILGIAFQDITENFLASIFLSIQRPFLTGDLIEINGIFGFVQSLTTRATVLMTQDGNHVQIPNSTVYKSIIRNFSANPNRREEFGVGIGFDDSISAAQEIAMKVLAEHPAVLADPEPLVLVDELGSATVNLRILFWLDGRQHSWLKVKSSVIRLVKRAFEDAGISMPDEARETLFPKGISVRMVDPAGAEPAAAPPAEEPESTYTDAEGGLRSEAEEIEAQARRSRPAEEGENLLDLEVAEEG